MVQPANFPLSPSQRLLTILSASDGLAEIGAYFGLMPRRYQSGEVDYTGSILKCGDHPVHTLLYEAANVMLTRFPETLKLKDWALAIAKRSTMRKARIALARRLAIIMSSCTPCCATAPSSNRRNQQH